MICERCWIEIIEGREATLWFSYLDHLYYETLPAGHWGIELNFDQTCKQLTLELQIPMHEYDLNRAIEDAKKCSD